MDADEIASNNGASHILSLATAHAKHANILGHKYNVLMDLAAIEAKSGECRT